MKKLTEQEVQTREEIYDETNLIMVATDNILRTMRQAGSERLQLDLLREFRQNLESFMRQHLHRDRLN